MTAISQQERHWHAIEIGTNWSNETYLQANVEINAHLWIKSDSNMLFIYWHNKSSCINTFIAFEMS
jgi:hypothetical protein